MAKKKPASKMKGQIPKQPRKGVSDATVSFTIRDPAGARAKAITDTPARSGSEASPSKRRCHTRADNPGSARKITNPNSDLENRVKEAIRAAREEPTPDPRAKPTRVPPEHHYDPGRSWTGINSKQVSWELTSVDGVMDSWAQNYAGDDPGTAEARMTAEDKQAIIDYLGDWCLYKDWDSLVASLPPLAYDNRICLLVSATVLKNIFECVFRNPFFYIDLGEEWDGGGSDLPPPFGVELNRFFQKALKVSAASAHDWRSSTVRLLNRFRPFTDADTPLMAKDVTPGIRSYNLRQKCIDQFTADILHSSSLISPMLSTKELSPERIQSRYRAMRKCYSTATEIAVRLYVQEGGFHFDESVEKVAPYQVPDKVRANRWVAATLNAPDMDQPSFEGRRAVMILWPTTWITEWKVPADIKKWREEYDAKHPPDYDWCYRDEKGVHHAVIASGIVLYEKDGREPPLSE